MNKDQLTSFMEKHKLDINKFADLLGVTPMAIQHWLVGRRSIAKPYGRLVRLFDRHPQLMKEFK